MSASYPGRRGILHRVRQRLRGRHRDGNVRDSIAELVQQSADDSHSNGTAPELDRQERALIANVLRLRGMTADDVMIPRADIIGMPVDVTLEQALDQIRREGHSRLPVYREQLDDILGMVHIKDVYAYVGRPEAFKLEAVLRCPLMVAPQIPVLDLLLQMRQARMHLALVVDEYGGIDGLLTIEDLVEEIVGEGGRFTKCRCDKQLSAAGILGGDIGERDRMTHHRVRLRVQPKRLAWQRRTVRRVIKSGAPPSAFGNRELHANSIGKQRGSGRRCRQHDIAGMVMAAVVHRHSGYASVGRGQAVYPNPDAHRSLRQLCRELRTECAHATRRDNSVASGQHLEGEEQNRSAG